jgi:hypothetical protein
MCAFIAVVALVFYVWQNLGYWAARIHQQSVTRELAAWEQEYSQVRNWHDADRSIDMLDYVRSYYVPAPGYRSDSETETTLEAQRARTLAAIAAGLRKFSGEDFGTDASRWREWREQHGPRLGADG